MGQTVPVPDLKEANIFLNDNEKLECSPKTLAAIINGSLNKIWVKHKNTMYGNTESVLSIYPTIKEFTFIKKHEEAARKHPVTKYLVEMLLDLGFKEV